MPATMSPRTIGRISLTVVSCAVASCAGAGQERSPALAGPAPPVGHVLRLERDKPTGDATPSPMLVAMKRELASAMGAFQAKDAAPYFLSYAVTDSRVFGISASLGALFDDSDSRSRVLDVDVRVGSSKEDNTHPMRGGDRFEGAFQAFAQRFVVPLEDDEGAMRARIWLRTEEQYRGAVERLAKVRAQRTVEVAEED